MSSELNRLIDRISSLRVLVIGDAILDSYFYGTASRLCQEAPVPVAEACERRDWSGGAGNVAANVRALGAEAVLVSAIGVDWEADRITASLRSSDVPVNHLHRSCERRTLAKHRVICGRQVMIRFDQGTIALLDAETEVQLQQDLSDSFRDADAIIVADYGYGVMTPKIIEQLRRLQSESPRVVTLDSKTPQRYRDVRATAFKPNYDQALRLLDADAKSRQEGIAFIVDSDQKLLDAAGTDLVVVTLDCDGAIVVRRDKPSYRIYGKPIADACSCGAGDTFIAAMTLSLALGAAAIQSAEIGTAAAEIVVKKDGTAVCTHHELKSSGGYRFPPMGLIEIERRVEEYRRAGRRIVLTNGCFDIVHPGHIWCLRQAKQLGDILVVGINSDESIKRLKGSNRPVNCLNDRMAVLGALAYVDHVVPFSDDTPHRLINAVRPDVFVKGGDYKLDTLPEAALVNELGGRIVILPFVEGRSSTKIIEQLRRTNS